MKKVVSIVVVIAALLVAMSGMAAASNIATTKHNLSSGYTNTTKGEIAEICVYCHTPHNANVANGVLWNRSNSVASFSVYTSSTMNEIMPTTLSGVSMACMSCHDGATSINTLLNYNGAAYPGTVTKLITGTFTNLGSDLGNDHPVSVAVTVAGDIKTPVNPSVRLFANKVECPSCHFVHDNSNPPFLAISNANSALCLQCHSK